MVRLRAFFRLVRRAVRGSIGRFAAIFAIVALGTGFLSGLMATTPDMRYTAGQYYDESRFMDVRVVGTLGLDDDDVAAVQAVDGVQTAVGAHILDVQLRTPDGDTLTARVHGVGDGYWGGTDERFLNRMELLSGRWPSAPGEAAVEIQFTGGALEEALGTVLTPADECEELACERLTVVGVVRSSYYISTAQLGSTSVGNGRLGAIVYVNDSEFTTDYYTDIFLRARDAQGVAAFSDEYEDAVDPLIDRLEDLGETQRFARRDRLVAEAQEEIDDAQRELDDARAEGQQKLDDALTELLDGEAELADAAREIEDGERKLRDALRELRDGEAEYADGVVQYGDGCAAFAQEIADAEQELADGRAEYEDGVRKLADARAELDDGEIEYAEGARKLRDAEQELIDGRAELDDGWAEYHDGERELADGRAEYEKGMSALRSARSELDDGWDSYAAGAARLAAGRAAYEQGVAEAAAGRARLDAGWAEYHAGEQELAAQLDALGQNKAQGAAALAFEDGSGMATLGVLNGLSGQLIAAGQTPPATLTDYLTGLAAAQQAAQLAGKTAAELDPTLLPAGAALYSALTDGMIAAARQTGEAQLAAGRAPLDAGEIEYAAGQQELAAAAQEIAAGERELSSARAMLSAGESEYDAGWRELKAAAREIEDGEAELADAYAQLEDGEAEYADGLAEWQSGADELADARAELDDGWAEYYDGEAELADAAQKLADGEAELAQGRADGQQELDDAAAELADARHKLDDGWRDYRKGVTELDDARVKYADGEQELADGRAEYEDGCADFARKIADAEDQIADARTALEDIEEPSWYVLGRDANAGYAAYDSDTLKVEAIAKVFPVFFFAVAALVASTTMSRMIEEERGQIGTLKALGYGSGAIAFKYFFYAGAAGLLGSVFGIAVGLRLFPNVLCNAYRLMYQLPPLEAAEHLRFALLSSALILAAIFVATFSALRGELREHTAQLLRPKAPPAGKRIFLERIKPLWERMRFTHKVTARNLLRYKKRFFMTVIGVAGCTALLVTGFGLRDSINAIVSKQFGELQTYNLSVTVRAAGDELRDHRLADYFGEGGLCADYMAAHMESCTGVQNGEETALYVIIPEDDARLGEYFVFRDRRSGTPVPFSSDGALLTEKAAARLGVGAGDSIILRRLDDTEAVIPISGVIENYIYGYLYLPHGLYEAGFGEQCDYTTLLARTEPLDEAQRDEVTSALLSSARTLSAAFNDGFIETFTDMLACIDYIVIVLILSAGALAFVVLYNLTNINVTERQKELATIKVLGFYAPEVNAYVTRETVLLSVIGCVVGLGCGVLLHAFVVRTAEVDAAMFGREIKTLSFVWSALITMLFTALVSIVMSFKLRRIDMVESLKAPE